MKNYAPILTAALLGVWAAGCGSSPQVSPETETAEERTDSDATSPSGALGQLAKGLQDAAKAVEDLQNVTVEPINFRELRDMLPSSAAGIARTNATGESSGITGMAVSMAEGEYTADDGRSITVKITDAGSMTSLFAFGMAWIDMNIDRETDSGFERTDDFDGHKSYQKFDSANGQQTGEVLIMVAKRFLVEVKGRGVSIEALRETAKSVDLGALEKRKNEGVTKNAES